METGLFPICGSLGGFHWILMCWVRLGIIVNEWEEVSKQNVQSSKVVMRASVGEISSSF